MATTTNFGWTTPDDTDLVKDGAAAIRTLGSAIDSSLVDLKGGTTGQVLSKTSNTDMDFTWVAQDDSNAIQNAIVDAKGDLIVASAADTPARLAVGTNGYVLTADSAETTGVKWAAPAGGGKVLQVVMDDRNGSTTITSTTMTDSGLEVTITPSSASSKILIISYFQGYVEHSGTVTNNYGEFQLLRGATVIQKAAPGTYAYASSTTPSFNYNCSFINLDSPATTSATTYKIQGRAVSGQSTTVAVVGSATNLLNIIAMEIGA